MQYSEDDLLYMNNVGRKSYQWELWAMCNNLCDFCYLGDTNRETNKEVQLISLNKVLKNIDELDFTVYNNISLIGGEFFQGQMDDPEVHDKFMELIQKCCDLYNAKKIGAMWITCTLTTGDQKHLYEMLDLIEKNGCMPKPEYGSSGFWLCTSWDAKGRFHTPRNAENWDYHMRNIHEKYPWVKFNTTIILTAEMMDLYINNEWKPHDFMEKYHTSLFFKQCGLGDVNIYAYAFNGMPTDEKWYNYKQKIQERIGWNFFPTRDQSIKFLRKFATEDADLYDRLYNIYYRADELHRNYNDGESATNNRNKGSKIESDSSVEMQINYCGHLYNYAPYIDSNKCCMCDKLAIWESIHE